MRIFLLPAVALAAARRAGRAPRPATSASPASTEVRVDGPFKVTADDRRRAVRPRQRLASARSTGSRSRSRGDTLIVHANRSSWGGYPGEDTGPVEISIGTHELSAAWLNGAGRLAIDRVKGLELRLCRSRARARPRSARPTSTS